MSFSHHTNCPRCGSRDNLGVWEDGHQWCFGCGYYKSGEGTIESVTSYFRQEENNNNDISLPSDFTSALPVEPRRWLTQYGITDKEIIENKIGFSHRNQQLIFPFFGKDNNELLFWQGRYFPTRKPKTITNGYPNRHITLLGVYDSPWICCVEDAVSAIKVGRYVTSYCLFGAHLSLVQATRLSKQTKRLAIWLDQDKTVEAMKFKEKYSPLFDEVKVISTVTDPKDTSDLLIKELLSVNS